jgi:aryl-alcohol dehydrogenase-like predicted oxidoreductase
MEYRRLGNTGLTVSRICLGCMSYGDPAATIAGSNLRWEWALNEEAARPFFKRAIELGITFFDTANVYSPDACLASSLAAKRSSSPRRSGG